MILSWSAVRRILMSHAFVWVSSIMSLGGTNSPGTMLVSYFLMAVRVDMLGVMSE